MPKSATSKPRLVRRYCYDPKRPHLRRRPPPVGGGAPPAGKRSAACLPGCAFRKLMPATQCQHDCTQWQGLSTSDAQTELASGFDASEVALAEWLHVSGVATLSEHRP